LNLPSVQDPNVDAALAALHHAPSRERVADLVRCLGHARNIDSSTLRDILAFASDRAMSALATRAAIVLDSPAIRDVFLALPVAIRSGFDVRLSDSLPRWNGGCPRCDAAIQSWNDSYGQPTYNYLYRCPACEWREEQASDEPTLATLYSEMHRHDVEQRVKRIAEQTARDLHAAETNCWPLHGLPFDRDAKYPPPLDRLAWTSVREVLVMGGEVEHVVVDAKDFLKDGADLRARASIRSVTLLAPDDQLTAIFASPLLQQLVGLGLAFDDIDAPIVDAILDAPAIPSLRHLHVDRFGFTSDMIAAVARADLTTSLTCFHLYPSGLTDSGDDYVALDNWSEAGRAVLALAETSDRKWFETFLGPLRRSVDRGRT